MNVVIDDKLEERFRKTIADTKGLHKGNISEALEEAIEAWIEQRAIELSKSGKK
jgi:hypothetical protein